MEKYKDYLMQFMKEFDYDSEVQKVLLSAFDKTYSFAESLEKFEKVRIQYEQDSWMDFSNVIKLSDDLAQETKVNPYTMYALTLILLAETCEKHYVANGIERDMWKQNFLDLKYKIEECKGVKGVIGTFCPEWYYRFFAATRFTFGKLQFEKDLFPYTYTKKGITLHPKDIVINVHIPRTGTRLTPQDVDFACAEACHFFEEKYQLKPIVFVCNSWLLYPENKNILAVDSNLYNFINRFDIIEVKEDTEYKDVWRLFNKEYTGNVDALPNDTSLQRAYVDRIKSGKSLGLGFGVWIYAI